MIDPTDVAIAIGAAEHILQMIEDASESELSQLHAICKELKNSQTERRELAEYEQIWKDLRDAMEPDNWPEEGLSPVQAEALRALLLLAQYMFAGQPNTFYINNGGNSHLMEDMLLEVFRKLFGPGMYAYPALKGTGLRALANFASIAEDNQLRDIWFFLLEDNGPFLKMTINWDDEYLHPMIHIVLQCRRFLMDFFDDHVFTNRRASKRKVWMPIFARMLVETDKHFNDEESPVFRLMFDLVYGLFQNGSLSTISLELLSLRTDEPRSVLARLGVPAQYIFLKFADGLLHRHPGIECYDIDPRDVVNVLEWIVRDVSELFVMRENFRIVEPGIIVDSVKLLLRMFEDISDPAMTLFKISLQDSTHLAEILVQLLGILCEHIPVQTLSDNTGLSRKKKPTDDELFLKLFQGMKSDIISILTLLLPAYEEVQDTIREAGGIPLILSQLIIDDDNPYIKERATLCIKLLLDNNEKNQSLIRELHPISVADGHKEHRSNHDFLMTNAGRTYPPQIQLILLQYTLILPLDSAIMPTTSKIQIDATTYLSVVTTQPSSPNSNPTLIFLHFWGGSSTTFRHLIPLLSAYPTVSPTFRGWGPSTGPSSPSEYSIKNLASDILSLISQMSLNSYILIGHSMGGKVAQLIASQRPSGLQALILLAPAPPTPLVLPTEELRQQQIHAYDKRESAEFVIRNVLSSTNLTDEDVDVTVRDCRAGSDVATKAWPTYAAGEDISAEVAEIDVPVSVLVGELDQVEPVERVRTEVVSRIAGAKLTVLHGVGHLLPLEAPKEVVQEIKAFIHR